jgi:hypothetical protein
MPLSTMVIAVLGQSLSDCPQLNKLGIIRLLLQIGVMTHSTPSG